MIPKAVFENLYKDIDGSSLSWKARNKMLESETEHLIYGEISYDDLVEIYNVEEIQKYFKDETSFCDLGSGTGRIVVAVSLMMNNLKAYTGVELLKELADKSVAVLRRYKEIDPKTAKKINYIKENFFNVDLSKFDIIFMHYPMKNAEDLYLQLETKMKAELKPGTLIISAIRQLRDLDTFELIRSKTIKAHYGDCTMYYHVKK